MPEEKLKNDIFIDCNVAKNFSNPMDAEYKKLVKWIQETGSLAVSNKLLAEYGRTNQNLNVLINSLMRDNRLNHISNKSHRSLIFPKNIEKRLTCNHEDREHLKTILLSYRKKAIIIDNAFRNDVNNHPKYNGIKPEAAAKPGLIDYE